MDDKAVKGLLNNLKPKQKLILTKGSEVHTLIPVQGRFLVDGRLMARMKGAFKSVRGWIDDGFEAVVGEL